MEGRNKRLAVLDKLAAERRRDLDQRSAETCATSSSQLDVFHSKADARVRETEEASREAMLLLREALHFTEAGTGVMTGALS